MTVQEVSTRDKSDAVDATRPALRDPSPSPVPEFVVTFFAILRKIFGRAEDVRETRHEPPAISDMGTWNLCITVEPDEVDGGYIAETPDVPGAMAQGDTEEEALANLGDAVAAIVQAKMDEQFQAMDLHDGGARSFRVILS